MNSKRENTKKILNSKCVVLSMVLLLFSTGGVFVQPAEAASPNIVSHSSYIDSIGDYDIVGEVQNLEPYPICYLEINATYYDSSNSIISTDFTYSSLNIILPNQKSPFRLFLNDEDGASRVDHYSLGVKSYFYTSTLPLDLRIVSNNGTTDNWGMTYIRGEIENAGTVNATEPTIYATCYDAQGNVVAVGSDDYVRVDFFDFFERNNQTPGQKSSFSIYIDSDRSSLVKTYSLSIDSRLDINKISTSTPSTPSSFGELNVSTYTLVAAVVTFLVVIVISVVVVAISKRRKRLQSNRLPQQITKS